MPDVDVFSALANPVRRDLLVQLRDGPQAAGQLAAHAERTHRLRRPAVSEHLQVLRRAHLVREVRRGRERIYHLEPAPFMEAETWLQDFTRYWRARLVALEDVLDEVAAADAADVNADDDPDPDDDDADADPDTDTKADGVTTDP